ncbi:MAG: hypothetical protein Q4G33_04560 [bacterium]|nr:hypothetical protein [bacterium]
MKHKLKDLKVSSVSFVEEGANPDAHIKITKSLEALPPCDSKNEHAEDEGLFARICNSVAKALGIKQETKPVEKGRDFNEKINESARREVTSEMWDVMYALYSSLCEALDDEEETNKAEAMHENIEQFNEHIGGFIECWANGKKVNFSAVHTTECISIAKAAIDRLNGIIGEADVNTGPERAAAGEGNIVNDFIIEEGESNMKIDKSRLTTEESAFFEAIMKKAAVNEEPKDTGKKTDEEDIDLIEGKSGKCAKSVQPPEPAPIGGGTEGQTATIYKGLPPEMAAEFAELKKFREEAEDRDLRAIAKKYEVIGKKEDDLVPLFKSLKAAGGSAYNDMISVLDATVEAVEKSNVFKEIGKSGHHGSEVSSVAKVKSYATEIMKASPQLTPEQAMAQAWTDHPELMEEYDAETGGNV